MRGRYDYMYMAFIVANTVESFIVIHEELNMLVHGEVIC